MADDRGGAWSRESRLSADPRQRVGVSCSGRNVHRGTGTIRHLMVRQRNGGAPRGVRMRPLSAVPGAPLALSRALSSEVRIEEAWPVDRITRPGKRALVRSGRTYSVESGEHGNVPH